MAVFKCKMCGGALEVAGDATVITCEYCGTKQTLPKLNDERRANLFDRANHFRRNNEFDKAMSIYENILNEDKTDAECYWSIVLCRYGIEYVEDPATKKRTPTVNRAQFTSIFMDEDYKSAINYADAFQKEIYEAEAKAIDEIQKGILEISQKEEPFDVFICYKETDANGRRTPDSVLATELYYELCKENFKVFFARITLEDKLGTAYEPYIFAALNSAKVMVVLGTRQENFNAVWVKNEWSRYLALIKNGAQKVLIPAYKDMDPYDLPDEFSHLQAQDMSKLGFMQDLVIAGAEEKPAVIKETVVASAPVNTNTAPLLERAFMFLEDGDFARADEFCEQVLNIEPKNAQAYLGKLMAQLKVRKKSDLRNCDKPFDQFNNYQKVIRFADDNLKTELEETIQFIINRNIENEMSQRYQNATLAMNASVASQDFRRVATLFAQISEYKDSKALSESCEEKAVEAEAKEKEAENQERYNYAFQLSKRSASEQIDAAKAFDGLGDYKDSKEQATAIREGLYIKAKEFLDKGSYTMASNYFTLLDNYKDSNDLRKECGRRKLELENQMAARTKKRIIIGVSALVALVVMVAVFAGVIMPAIRYGKAEKHFENGEYPEAISIYESLGDRKDAPEKLIESKYNYALELENKGEKAKAAIMFYNASGYKDAKQKSFALWDECIVRETVAAGDGHIAAVKSDGTVVATGNNRNGQCNVETWTDIVAVLAEDYTTIGLKADGTVVVAGSMGSVSWTDIVAISRGYEHTVGLKADGTVVAGGDDGDGQCDVEDWTDIIAISAGFTHTVGLKSDGTVVATGDNYYGQCDVADWTDIVAISAGANHTVGLKSDGTVVAVGNNISGRCDVSGWTDIVAISAGDFHTVGVNADGTVVAVGSDSYGRLNVGDWADIVAVSACEDGIVGLKADGTVVATDEYNRCFYEHWTDIKLPNTVR